MEHGGNVWDALSPGDWLDFSANLRPEGVPDWVRAAMERALAHARYYPDRSMRAARRGLAAYAGVSEACMLPAAGGAAAIDLLVASARGRVLTQAPAFGEYAARAAAQGKEHALFEGEFAPGDMLILGNPNNPTGAAPGREAIFALRERAVRAGAEVVADEAFVDFCPERSVRGEVGEGLTVVGSLTKSLCIPGVRLGYVCAAPERVAALERRALPWSLNMLAAAVAEALPGHEEELAGDAARNAGRRVRLARGLAALGARVLPSEANFLLADFGRDMTEAARALRRGRILVRTCESFGLPSSVWRLAVRTDGENERLLEALALCLGGGEEGPCGENR
ncbi:MAG: aminotransferase class I/II-fold pyridoxal phosphate-dependent enzyme [Clostridia bacterium]|nr:aminotransferase class I/II-fold pyridoxal phosphate-dependent enzyme [Clostridia bacterium]